MIEVSLKQYPVVGILGSRQVGKTTLAKMIERSLSKKPLYLDLELPSDLSKLQEPELYLSQFSDSLVILDEIQRMPALFPLMRSLVDKKKSSGRFLILGSASPDLIRQSSESLAGRIIYHELTPFNLNEVGTTKFRQLGLRGAILKVILREMTAKVFYGENHSSKPILRWISLSLEFVFLQPNSGDSGQCSPIPMDNFGTQAKSQTASE